MTNPCPLPDLFYAVVTSGYAEHGAAKVAFWHKSSRPEKQRAEIAVCLANFIKWAREQGFTREEIMAWEAMR